MAIDFAHYSGREQAFVKHTFLDKYLPALIGRVGSVYTDFVYIDGFAGPWQSAAGKTFGDTSFGIALAHMVNQKRFFAESKRRNVQMRAFLVEQDHRAFEQLKQAVGQFPEIEVSPLHGRMEDHAADIAKAIPQTAFSFSLIDPKGFPEINAITPLLARPNSEALVNFMFDFANRFANTDLIPALGQWLSAIIAEEWQSRIAGLTGEAREEALQTMAAEALRAKGSYQFAPVISVDKVRQNRSLYKLIFLSRHPEGLKVFRDSQRRALDAQANARANVRAQDRAAASSMDDLFQGTDAVPHDRSSLMIKRGQEHAAAELENLLKATGDQGLKWLDVWPSILAKYVVTHSSLGRTANDLRKQQRISIVEWPNERTFIPKDHYRMIWRQ